MNLFRTLAFISLLLAFQSNAAQLPAYYPDYFPHAGQVNQLDTQARTIVIADAMFRLSDNLHVYTPKSEFANLNQIKVGDRVGARYIHSREGVMITHLWLLPDDAPTIPLP